MVERDAVEKELIAIAKKFGAVSLGIGKNKQELQRRWLARVLGFPRQFIMTYTTSAHFESKFDAPKFAAAIDDLSRRYDCRIDWQLAVLAFADKKRLRAGN